AKARAGEPGQTGRLEHIQNELVSLVIPAILRIETLPLLVIDRNPHLGRIAEIKVFRRPVVLAAPEILRIPHIRIVVKPLPVRATILPAPHPAVRPVLSIRRRRQPSQQHARDDHRKQSRQQHSPNHGSFLRSGGNDRQPCLPTENHRPPPAAAFSEYPAQPAFSADGRANWVGDSSDPANFAGHQRLPLPRRTLNSLTLANFRMNEPASLPSSPRLESAIVEFHQQLERGQTPDRAALLQQYSDVADALAEFFADHDRLSNLARPSPPANVVEQTAIHEPGLPRSSD